MNFRRKNKLYALSSNLQVKGFTLIEFLIIIGLIGIMTAVSIASYTSFSESSKLKNETQKMMSVFSLAQKRAVSGDLGVGCTNCSLNSFTVSWNSTTQLYSTVGSRVNGVNPTEAFDQIAYSFDPVNKNVSLLDTGNVIFSSLTGAPDSSKTIRLKNITKNECMQIVISTVGLMSSSSVVCP